MSELSPLYVRVKDSHKVFGIGRSTIYRLAKDGELTIHKVGASSLLRVAEVESVILNGKKSSGGQPGDPR